MSGRTAFARPRVVVSRCLELEPCRYDGQSIRARIVPLLGGEAELLPVCPEVEIGLGVPRPPIRLVAAGGSGADAAGPRLVQPATGRDVTAAVHAFAAGYLADLAAVDGFLLKARSPSCGIKDVRIYAADAGTPAGKGAGLFAAAVLARFPGVAVEDEGRLTNFRLRHHFLTRIYALAGLRRVEASGAMARLVEFHADHKLLLLAHDEPALRVLGRIVANGGRLPFEEVVRAYRSAFAGALARPARIGPNINALMHIQGHASDHLTAAEKRHFAEVLDDYRAGRAPLSVPLALARAWIARYEIAWLATQRFFAPYPPALLDLRDSGGDPALG